MTRLKPRLFTLQKRNWNKEKQKGVYPPVQLERICWSGSILAKQEYCGDTVNFRTHKESYKDKSSVKNPQENWLIFNDTHEAIIDRETWELAQKLTKTPRRVDTTGVANPLTGLVYCADCGAKMYNHRFFRAYYADDK